MKKNNRAIIVISIVIVILLIIVLVCVFNKKSDKETNNTYKWEIKDSGELPEGFYQSIIDDKDDKNHCIDDICVDKIEIKFNNTTGEINYTLTNNSKKTIKKAYYYLKLSNNEKILIYIKKVKRGQTFNGQAYFNDMNMYNVNSYKLVKLTKKELKEVK